jgi:hypothetical protein
MPYTEDRSAWFEGQGLWQHVPESDWQDWTWQLKNRITTVEQLERYMTLTAEEKAGCAFANQKLALAITPYFFNLIDRNDPDCPIRKQVIPRRRDGRVRGGDARFARRGRALAGARPRAPLSGPRAVSRDRPLRAYCRYCTRSRLVSNAQDYNFHPEYEQGAALHRGASRGARRAALGRRPAAALRQEARAPAQPAARDQARGVHPHRLAHPGVPAAAHHAGALRDFQEIRPDLDEHPREPSEGVHRRAEGRLRAAVLRRRAARQPERAAARA